MRLLGIILPHCPFLHAVSTSVASAFAVSNALSPRGTRVNLAHLQARPDTEVGDINVARLDSFLVLCRLLQLLAVLPLRPSPMRSPPRGARCSRAPSLVPLRLFPFHFH